MLSRPLPHLQAWTTHLRDQPIPVLESTAQALAELARLEEERACVDAAMIARVVDADPLMTLRLMAHVGCRRSARQVTDVETVTAAVMLMGIDPFFREFAALETIESRLAPEPQALDGLQQVLRRAWRAAHFAQAFAVHRMDGDAPVLREAALLHDFAEMLLWCHAPALALEIRSRLAADVHLRSRAAQQEVLNVDLGDLEQELMRCWHLPQLLIQLTNDRAAGHALVFPQVRTVRLAVRVARHSETGWDNAALPDDVDEVADLLNLSAPATLRLLQEIER
ncbi:MAG: HDOD domain-containing protein [Leptothrix sp. (in: Bacteria)]|nr:HDOD domain-containing protein [Leptothrix sp. (in: b-proteobacteria)]